MLVMITNTASVDEKMVIMARAIDKLTKTIEEKNVQIPSLINKLEAQNIGNYSQGHSQPPSFTLLITPTNNEQHVSSSKHVTNQTLRNTYVVWLFVQHLHSMILNTIRAQFGTPLPSLSQICLKYLKSYMKTIDTLRICLLGTNPPSSSSLMEKATDKDRKSTRLNSSH